MNPDGPRPSPAGNALLESFRGAGRQLLRVPRAWALLPVLSWMALIFWLSSLPGGQAQGLVGPFGNFAHAPEFGLLALFMLLVLPRADGWVKLGRREVALVFIAATGYGALDELHQRNVPGRFATPFDLATDAMGVACVLWIVAYVGHGRATGRGLIQRLVLGVLACLLAGAVPTALQYFSG